jgi:hypothetical protein
MLYTLNIRGPRVYALLLKGYNYPYRYLLALTILPISY